MSEQEKGLPKIDGTDYSEWKVQVEAYLTARDKVWVITHKRNPENLQR